MATEAIVIAGRPDLPAVKSPEGFAVNACPNCGAKYTLLYRESRVITAEVGPDTKTLPTVAGNRVRRFFIMMRCNGCGLSYRAREKAELLLGSSWRMAFGWV